MYEPLRTTRLDHLEHSINDSNTLAYEEAVMVWRDLNHFQRRRLSKISSNDIDLIYNIYATYFEYGIELRVNR
tara:strand:- start:1038 stop:1256 length:219 start_codon:yes stop_codon:yes gene_type:complete